MDNIEKLTLENNAYRKVINTTIHQQLVLMSLNPREEIGMEIHPKTTQFIRIEKGRAIAIIDNKAYDLKSGDFLMIPPNKYHNIINKSSKKSLKLYTIYSPPHHKKTCLQYTKKSKEC
jgi:mannose-6-phosphate isomerase-like protein (cupin superfamily)